MRQLYMVDGRVVPAETLVETPRGWVEPSPVRCPNGHIIANTGVTVGWLACLVDGRTGHRLHTCNSCEGVVYTPPRDEACVCEISDPPAAS